jgi:hypothetical protein
MEGLVGGGIKKHPKVLRAPFKGSQTSRVSGAIGNPHVAHGVSSVRAGSQDRTPRLS